MVTVGSLCTGFGGLDMGLALALGVPLRHAWHVEIDPWPAAILGIRYPGVPNHGDLKTLDHTALEPVDWLTAGYPCQPFSSAGLQLGVADARHLWPYVAHTIGELRPRNVLLENVRGHVRRGLDSVLADLAALGYDAVWGVVRASDAGAPHRRERIFVVATDTTDDGQQRSRSAWERRPRSAHCDLAVADAHRAGLGGLAQLHGREAGGVESAHRGHADGRGDGTDWGAYTGAIRRWEAVLGRPAPHPTEPGRNTERLRARFVEWMMGLPAGWVTDIPDLPRSAQLKALGNGVVPQQAALALSLLLPTALAVAA